MSKFIKRFVFVLCSVLVITMLSSCVTYSMKVFAPVDKDEQVSIEIKKIIQKKQLGWWGLFIPITPTESQGFEVLITNKTDKPQSINWNQSSFNWHGRSSSIITEGSKYIQAGSNSIPNTAVGVNKTVKVIIYPAKNVEWTGDDWEINGMDLKKGDEISIIAFTESGLQIETTYEVERSDGVHFIW